MNKKKKKKKKHTYCNGTEIFSICLITDILKLLREVKHPLGIVLCYGSPYNLIKIIGPFQPFCNHKVLINLNLPIIVVLVEMQGKSQKYFDLLAFNPNPYGLFSSYHLWRGGVLSTPPSENYLRFLRIQYNLVQLQIKSFLACSTIWVWLPHLVTSQ